MQINCYRRGSLTVEASLIFPMVFTCIVFVIYMGFFLHDLSIIKSVSMEAVLYGARGEMLDIGEPEDMGIRAYEELIGNKLIQMKTVTGIGTSPGGVQITADISSSLTSGEVASEACTISPQRVIRIIRGVMEWKNEVSVQ